MYTSLSMMDLLINKSDHFQKRKNTYIDVKGRVASSFINLLLVLQVLLKSEILFLPST